MSRLLEMSLIPRSTWYDNVRSRVSRHKWNAIRAYSVKPSCQYCGHKGRLFTHEVWKYDDKLRIQKLAGFESVCSLCHAIKHLGLAGLMAKRGDHDYAQLIKHYCEVNGCSEEDFVQDRKEAFELWQERSSHGWTVDISYLDSLKLPRRVSNYQAKKGEVREWMKTHPSEVQRIKNSYSDVLACRSHTIV